MVSVGNEPVGISGACWNLPDAFIEFREYCQWLSDMKWETQQSDFSSVWLNRKITPKNTVTVNTVDQSAIGQT